MDTRIMQCSGRLLLGGLFIMLINVPLFAQIGPGHKIELLLHQKNHDKSWVDKMAREINGLKDSNPPLAAEYAEIVYEKKF
ncbi:hypothetical protein [Draconibacterium halophilum]|uniref:Uncharacterized protein n=1 Tax=Draconibacterium halophilum TaxID=2706887 RepID=A0A6C0RD49_9BACT|nr:hypothetical protein [Draconibacterium halophilum]QIA08059.1 hypothetical protein G0Q07_10090 [Draconibacterium halophilum]